MSARSVGVEDKILAVVAAAVVGVDGSALVAVGMASSFDDDSIVFLSVSKKVPQQLSILWCCVFTT